LLSSFELPASSIHTSFHTHKRASIIVGGSTINPTLGQKAAGVQLLILDVDGVLTGGAIILGSEGMELKAFSTLDGTAVAMAHKVGLKVAIITGRVSEAVTARASELGIKDLFQGSMDKMETYESLLKRHQLTDQQVAYMGDDLLDLPLMKRAGLKVAVANACGELKAMADYVTLASGGDGAVREVVELLLGWREGKETWFIEEDEN
jgi:3-deoxy-D-manno-octulosonate 8-phosphate phosphatase (KDO 8-P phosphatase)